MRYSDFWRDTGKVLRITEDMLHVDTDRPFRVVIDAILRHIVAGLLWQRGDMPEHRRQLVRKAPEKPFQQGVLLFIPVKTGINGFVPSGVEARMEAAKFILDVEVICRAAGVSFVLVVNKLFLKDRVNVPLQNRSIWIFR